MKVKDLISYCNDIGLNNFICPNECHYFNQCNMFRLKHHTTPYLLDEIFIQKITGFDYEKHKEEEI